MLRLPSGFLDVWEHVERTFGQAAGKAFDLIQAGNEYVPAALELSAHFVDGTLISSQRFDASDLGEAGGARSGVRRQASNLGRQVGAHDAVAHAPTGHGIGLRETVEE